MTDFQRRQAEQARMQSDHERPSVYPPDCGLGAPVRSFEETHSAVDVLKQRFYIPAMVRELYAGETVEVLCSPWGRVGERVIVSFGEGGEPEIRRALARAWAV